MTSILAIGAKLPRDHTVEEELATLDDEATFEMTNLPTALTGVAGVLFISTEMASHGPRVKYFLKTGKRQPSFSVSIANEPRVVANSLPEWVLNNRAPAVIAWVRLNRQALLRFWEEGDTWTIDELNAFVEQLQKVAPG